MPPFVAKAKPVKNPPLKWHGGKHDLAEWIISLMPPRCEEPGRPSPSDPGWLHFVEPYFGGGSVMLAMDPEGVSEVANDLNGELTNFWAMLQNTETFAAFKRLVDTVPFGQAEWVQARDFLKSENTQGTDKYAGYGGWSIAREAAFFVHCRHSYAGRMKEFAAVTRNRVRRGMNEQVSAWLSCVDGLPEVHARMRRVLILNEPALDVIRSQDGPRTLFYLDPPYLHETRVTTGEYSHEMTYEEHADLLDLLTGIEGRFLLSGYDSPLYEAARESNSWRRYEKKINNHASSAKTKPVKTECVWTNY